MRQIRQGVFETNSSSCHAIVVMSKENFEKFKNDEVAIDREYFDYSDDYETHLSIIDDEHLFDYTKAYYDAVAHIKDISYEPRRKRTEEWFNTHSIDDFKNTLINKRYANPEEHEDLLDLLYDCDSVPIYYSDEDMFGGCNVTEFKDTVIISTEVCC